jgi:hypothetical protein
MLSHYPPALGTRSSVVGPTVYACLELFTIVMKQVSTSELGNSGGHHFPANGAIGFIARHIDGRNKR